MSCVKATYLTRNVFTARTTKNAFSIRTGIIFHLYEETVYIACTLKCAYLENVYAPKFEKKVLMLLSPKISIHN